MQKTASRALMLDYYHSHEKYKHSKLAANKRTKNLREKTIRKNRKATLSNGSKYKYSNLRQYLFKLAHN